MFLLSVDATGLVVLVYNFSKGRTKTRAGTLAVYWSKDSTLLTPLPVQPDQLFSRVTMA
jgi:hypothetical protein